MKSIRFHYAICLLLAAVVQPLAALPFETTKKIERQADGSYLEQNNTERFEFELKDKDKNLLGRVRFERYDDKGYIAWLGVEQQHRGKGLGKKLLTNACALLKRKGCKEIYLYVMDGNRNTVAVNLYKKLGFRGDPNRYMKLDC